MLGIDKLKMDIKNARLDTEFNCHLREMKPFVLKLPVKSDRQRCAMWVKKLSEPPLTTQSRKSRDLYAKLLLYMLKRGILDGPFVVKPEEGPLKELPSYMSVLFENSFGSDSWSYDEIQKSNLKVPATDVPDWVSTELDESLITTTTSKENQDPNAPMSSLHDLHQLNLSKSDGHLQLARSGVEYNLGKPDRSSAFRDESNLIRMHEKELEMNTKVLQAQFHEEKLKLQHKHDKAVQKILDRKNSEIEELKRHFKNKEDGYEKTVMKVDRRAQSLAKEVQMLKESKEKQIEELKLVIDETSEAAKVEYDVKVQEVMGVFERDKYELQKMHTKKIQELLEDTNHRLLKMEEEYNAQTTATKMITSELEARVSQLTQETESLSIAKQSLFDEKEHIENILNDTEKKLNQFAEKYESLQSEFKLENDDHQLQLTSLLSKHNASMEHLKQEHNVFINKAQDTTRDFEDQIQSLKHAMQDSEQQRMRELRERESLHQQDIASIQRLHEKQLHQLQNEWDQDKSDHLKEIRSVEAIVHERDEQITKLSAQQKQSAEQAEKIFEQYKNQLSDAQRKAYSDMQAQLHIMSSELEDSKRQQKRLKGEIELQLDELKARHHEDLNEMRMKCELEKTSLTQQAIADRDDLSKTHEKQLDDAEQRMRSTLEEQEKITEERKEQHHKTVIAMEAQIRELREELVSANALRRQQLVELGLLREEERQMSIRDHEAVVNRLEAEIDKQRLAMHQQNAADLDKQAHKTKLRLESLEKDYKQRLDRAYERISELQQKENSLRDELSKAQADYEQQMADNVAKRKDDTKKLHLQMESANVVLAAELDSEREKCNSIHRQFQKAEFEFKDKVTRVKMECEEKLKGLLPVSLKNDMEDTINCLRSQVSSLQQRVSILLEQLDEYRRLPSLYQTPALTPGQLS